MKLTEFDYDLPENLIADYPANIRDHSRLLVLNRANGEIADRNFTDILNYFDSGDLLVINNSKVFPARLLGKKVSGGKAEILLDHEDSPGTWEAIGKGLKVGQEIILGEDGLVANVIDRKNESVLLKFNKKSEQIFEEFLKIGKIPLPPYIEKKRIKNKQKKCDDKSRYQTVYAKKYGSCAAPTAGLHFTPELLRKIKDRGVIVEEVTLHVGLGTFLPIKSEEIENHKIHKELFTVKTDLGETIKKTKASGKKVIAVGTTTTRVLETVCKEEENRNSGWTDLYIYPGFKFRCVDAIITNFHLPKSSLLVLISAFAGKELVFRAYKYAIDHNYRFYSYGDATLII